MNNLQLMALDVVYGALRSAKDSRIHDVTMDNDNKDGEIILTLCDGNENRTVVLHSKDLTETSDEAQP